MIKSAFVTRKQKNIKFIFKNGKKELYCLSYITFEKGLRNTLPFNSYTFTQLKKQKLSDEEAFKNTKEL